jgi:integrase/recombinase XerD
MDVGDYFQKGKRWWFRFHEKGGKHHEMPVHHRAEEYLDAYLAAAGIWEEKKSPLWRTLDPRRQLTERRLNRSEVWSMVKRRARQAGLSESTTCHSFRATGITVYLQNGGALETAQHMANHASSQTTKLYDRRAEEVSLDEVERIRI